MSSTKQRQRLNNFDVHETLYQINLSFEDYKYTVTFTFVYCGNAGFGGVLVPGSM